MLMLDGALLIRKTQVFFDQAEIETRVIGFVRCAHGLHSSRWLQRRKETLRRTILDVFPDADLVAVRIGDVPHAGQLGRIADNSALREAQHIAIEGDCELQFGALQDGHDRVQLRPAHTTSQQKGRTFRPALD